MPADPQRSTAQEQVPCRQSVGPIEDHDWECVMIFGVPEPYVRAYCSCGWQGVGRDLLREAEADGEKHALEYVPVSTGPFG